MRVLFLDFDGVLHPAPLASQDRHMQWLPSLRSVLQPRQDVGIVVHSTWRYMYTPAELRELLVDAGAPFLGVVPRGPRYEAILWWLHLNPTFRDYRIVDDDLSEFPQPAPTQLVICDESQGILTRGVLDMLERWLHGGENNSAC